MTTETTRETVVEDLIALFEGDPRAAIAALLDENERLSRFIDRHVSAGATRGGLHHLERLIEWE